MSEAALWQAAFTCCLVLEKRKASPSMNHISALRTAVQIRYARRHSTSTCQLAGYFFG